MKTSNDCRKRALPISFLLVAAFAASSCGGEAALVPPPPPPLPPASPAEVQPRAEARADAGMVVSPRPLTTDEGMWLLNDFPSDRLAKLHGFGPGQEWLDHVRLSSVRMLLARRANSASHSMPSRVWRR